MARDTSAERVRGEVRREGRRPWNPPAVVELPRLTELTLSSSISGSGIISNGSGSPVF